jgi:anti-sigma-K factor RskA
VLPLPVRRLWLVRTTAAVAAVAACAAVALGVWATTLSHSLDSERSARTAEARAVHVVMDPASKKVALHGGDGMLAVDQTGRAVLVVHRLAPAPANKVYEAWVIPPGSRPIRAGLFKGGGSMTMVPLDEMVPTGSMVATTVERAGGVEAPTDTPILTAQT